MSLAYGAGASMISVAELCLGTGNSGTCPSEACLSAGRARRPHTLRNNWPALVTRSKR